MSEHDPARPARDDIEPADGGRRLEPFVPELAVELGTEADPPVWRRVEGSMLSADISGFTALSEKLAGKGKAGAEEITELINVCFTALIDAAYEFGGEVLKFGGDALLVLFRGDNHQRRATDGGLLMQVVLHASAAAKRASLTMTVGVAEGPFDVFLVGSGYRELLVSGDRASEVIRLEGEAAKGDTLVSPTIAELLPAAMCVREESGGVVVTGSTGDQPSGPVPRSVHDADLEPYVPRPVIDQLSAFAGLGGEHRLVTVGFTMVTGVSNQLEQHGTASTAVGLGQVVDDVVAACERFGVTALHTDIAPDGVKFVLCAGAPVNPGDTADALLQAALEIAESSTPFVIRQGVQTGRVFAGFLGSDYRRTYTLMGDPVNTAARMLGKAGDREIVAVETVVEDTRAVFDSEALEPFLVKGKSEPIVAHKVRAATGQVRRDSADTRLIGRRRELDILTRAIGELDAVIEIVAPAGVGKSRLLDAAWDAAEGLRIHQASCTPYGAGTPYGVFKPLLRGGTGIPLEADAETAGDMLTSLTREVAPELLPMLPLLAIPFGATVPATPEADTISPEYRRARLHDVVLRFIDATTTSPILLVAEDAHWIDDASGELLHHLIRAAADRPWAGIITRRDEGTWKVESMPHVSTLRLEPLSGDDIRNLAVEVSDRALADAELEIIEERAAGNPLFAVELARAMSGSTTEVPDSVEDLIGARIDALGPASRRLVRVAAVFGNEFAEGDLQAVASTLDDMPFDIDAADLGGVLARRRQGRVAFNHALYRDVAYEGLPFRQRRRLHEVVAVTLEQATDDPREIAGLLSLHFAQARRHREAYDYAVRAADDAMNSFAHREASQLLERALSAGRYCRDVDAPERAALYERLGRSREFSGQLQSADEAYRRIRRLTDDLDTNVAALRRQARVRQKQNRLSAAIRMLRQAERVLHSLDAEPWVHRRLAEIHLNLSGIRMDQGRLAEARLEGESAERHAVAAGDDALRVQAYGAIVGATTDWAEAQRYVEPGLGPDAPTDAYEARSILAINLGMCAFFAGRWQRSVELYEQGRVAADAMGNVTAGALAAMNAAEVLVDQGHLDQAVDVLAHVERVLGAAGYEAALLYAQMLHATADVRRGKVDEGLPVLIRCAGEFRDGSMLLYALEAELRIGEARLYQGELDEARALGEQAMVDAEQVARRSVIEARAQRLLGLTAEARGERDEAITRLEAAVEICRREDLRYELALTLAPLSEIVPNGEELGREAREILADLGVVRLPAASLPA